MSAPLLTEEELVALRTELHRTAMPEPDAVRLVAGDRNIRKRMPVIETRLNLFAEQVKGLVLKSLRLVCPTQLHPNEITGPRSARAEFSKMAYVTEIKIEKRGVVGFLGIDSVLGLALVEQAFGAPPGDAAALIPQDGNPQRNRLTELEKQTAMPLVNEIVAALGNNFLPQGAAPLQSNQLAIVQAVEWPEDVEVVVVWRMTFRMKEATGDVTAILMPNLFEQINANPNIDPTESQKPWLAQHLIKATVELTCELGRCDMTVGELISLEVGDLLKLTSAQTDPLPVLIEGTNKWFSKPMQRNGTLGIELVGSVE